MAATQAQLDDLATDITAVLDLAPFEVGHINILRLTEGVWMFNIQEHGEQPSDAITIGDD